ncbi:PUF nine target 1 [Trypanosoma theileri]|uniref:PUF nine target 1 n=1 Tax=Trypanosoma theileri TaxID=67003 RepID=A0A1X0NV07_9TRYP|nr:PUF nine target 1 [Trypanosoma theileri]ORC88537.1 PUF nine target 1 [Trypanosoma theileri]
MSSKGSRRCNRLIVLFSSINDVTAWPFWKFLQMKKVKGVTDLSILAFNSHGGSFEARINGHEYTLKNYENVAGYRQDMLERFLHRWYDPGRSYFVYGGHGMGDHLELERNRTVLHCHELAAIFGDKKFEAIVFDACFMASLECAYYLRNNTRYIGGCEGYLWEPDTSLDQHVFNTYTASAMSRFRDPKHILLAIQRDYCSKSPLADFSVLDTTHVEALRNYVEEHVIQRAYDRATFYNFKQQQKLSSMAEEALQVTLQNTNNNIKTPLSSSLGSSSSSSSLSMSTSPCSPSVSLSSSSSSSAKTQRAVATRGENKKLARRLQLQQSVQFEHALYPSETTDKYILDLRSYLIDMAREEEEKGGVFLNSNSNTLSSSSSRTTVVESHGSLPPKKNHHHSLFAKGSAHEGLDLFHRVVVSHTPPEDKHIYASHLGGLSFPVYEFNTTSKPLHPWRRIDKKKFMQKAKEFLEKGAVQDVQMSERSCNDSSSSSSSSSSNGSSNVVGGGFPNVTEKNTSTSTTTTTSTSSSAAIPTVYLPLLGNCNDSNSCSNTSGGSGGREPEMKKCHVKQ